MHHPLNIHIEENVNVLLQKLFFFQNILLQTNGIYKIFVTFRKEPVMHSLKNLPKSPITGKYTKPDIVVIELEQSFVFNDYIKPACLPTKPIDPGTVCYASGWGLTYHWKLSDGDNIMPESGYLELQAADVKVLSDEDCEKNLLEFLKKMGTKIGMFYHALSFKLGVFLKTNYIFGMRQKNLLIMVGQKTLNI